METKSSNQFKKFHIEQNINQYQVVQSMKQENFPEQHFLRIPTQANKRSSRFSTKNKMMEKQKKLDMEKQSQIYFQNIFKQQRKRMYVKNFIGKLKQSIVRSNKISHSCLDFEDNIIQQQQINGIKIEKYQNLAFAFLGIFHLILLTLISTLGIIFQEVSHSNVCFIIQIANLIFHLFEMFINFTTIKTVQGKKIQKIKEIARQYMWGKFTFQLVILIIFIIDLSSFGKFQFLRLLYLIKLSTVHEKLERIQLVLINNQHKELFWSLIKIVTFNFFFAHILSIMLVSMSQDNKQQSWMAHKYIYLMPWYQQYIWGYYWGVTIMMSVGFGDLVASNTTQALYLIFIEMFSCFVLSYNFNSIGNIIKQIASFDVEKQKKFKIFTKISQNVNINQEFNKKIYKFIKEESKIKRNFNLEEEEGFIKQLPQNFQNNLKIQSNKPIFSQLNFFRNLSEKMIQDLAVKITKKLAHPQQLIYEKSKSIGVLILGEGEYGLALHRPSNRSHGRIIQNLKIQKKDHKLLSLDFLFSQVLPYDVKSKDYGLIYQLKKQQFCKCLKNNSYDYEYYRMIVDKSQFISNQMEIWKCQICQNEKHTLFKCPKIHYFPLYMHIINKRLFSQGKILQRVNKFQREKKKKFAPLTDLDIVKRWVMHRRVRKMQDNLGLKQIQNYRRKNIKKDMNIQQLFNASKFYKEASNYIKDQLCDFLCRANQKVWDLQQFQIGYNYKYYFINDNPCNLNYFRVKKFSDFMIGVVKENTKIQQSKLQK